MLGNLIAYEISDRTETEKSLCNAAKNIRKIEYKIKVESNIQNEQKRLISEHEYIDSMLFKKGIESVSQYNFNDAFYKTLITIGTQSPRQKGSDLLLSGIILNEEIGCLLELDIKDNRWIEFCENVQTRGNIILISDKSTAMPIQNQIIASDMQETIYVQGSDYENDDVVISNEKNNSIKTLLLNQFETAVNKNINITVNFSNIPHNIITEVFHNYTYKKRANEAAVIEVTYADGTKARPLKLGIRNGCVDSSSLDGNIAEENFSLISMRHQDLDHITAISWFRNSNVSQSRSLALSDEYCYLQSLKEFENFSKEISGGFKMNLYQTGFQPAVIGFYRAYIELKTKGLIDNIFIVPIYYDGDKYYSGETWY